MENIKYISWPSCSSKMITFSLSKIHLLHKLTACSTVDSWSCVKPNAPQKECSWLVFKSVVHELTIILNIATLTWYCNTLQFTRFGCKQNHISKLFVQMYRFWLTFTEEVSVIISTVLQGFDTVAWAAGRTSGLWKGGCWYTGSGDLTGTSTNDLAQDLGSQLSPLTPNRQLLQQNPEHLTSWYPLVQGVQTSVCVRVYVCDVDLDLQSFSYAIHHPTALVVGYISHNFTLWFLIQISYSDSHTYTIFESWTYDNFMTGFQWH